MPPDPGPDAETADRIDADFGAYCQTGDPAALARVFDATAQKLLHLALHLGSPEATAEDLVQQTYLRIIEHSSTFETGRHFLPWATTILQNEARAAFRKARRAHRLTSAPPDPRPPTDLAAECEALDVLEETLHRLPAKYQHVLRLKLMEGRDNGEIAAALALPVATVRTQVHRGLQKLRELLPAGLTGTALILLHSRGLAQVRERVLRRATELARPNGTAPRSKLLLWSAPVAILLAVIAWTVPPLVTSVPTTQPNGAPQGTGLSATHVPVGARTVGARTVLPPNAASLPTRAGPIPSGHWQLSGRVTDLDGQPLAAAKVQATLLWGCAGQDLPEAQSDAAGRYRLDIGALRRLGSTGLVDAQVQVVAYAAGHHPSDVLFLEAVAELALDPDALFEDRNFELNVPMRPGACVFAKVRGPEGRALRGTVSASIPRSLNEERAPTWRLQELSTDGQLCLALPERGASVLRLHGPDGALQIPLPDPRGSDLHLGTLCLQQGTSLRARLLIQGQEPWPYAYYELRREEDQSIARGRALRNGCIEHHGLQAGAYTLMVADHTGTEQLFTVHAGAPSRDLAVAGQLLVLSVCGPNGQPVPGVPLRSRTSFSSGSTRYHDIRFEAGRYHLLLPQGGSWTFRPSHWLVDGGELVHKATAGPPIVQRQLPVSLRRDLGAVRLHITGKMGAPVPTGTLQLTPLLDDFGGAEVRLDRLRAGIPAGAYELHVRAPGYRPGRVRFEAIADTAIDVDVQLQPGAQARALLSGDGPRRRQAQLGRILDGHFRPIGLLRDDRGSTHVSTGEVLHLQDCLPTGIHHLQVRAGRLRSEVVEVELTPDHVPLVRFEMRDR